MTETVSVSISGIAFSFISYENIKCDSNQEGFLLGEFITKETNHVTDAEHTVVNKQNIIKIKSVIPCPHQFYFYNAAGQLDMSKLNRILGNQKDKVVGWYLFKHKQIVPPKLTLREKIIHKQIAKLLHLPLSTTCLLTLKTSNNNATYSFNQTFLRYHMSKYESLPLRVENLTLPNYSYKLPEPMPNVLTKVIKSIKTSNPESHIFIQKIQEGLQCHMNYLLEESIDKEEQLFKLEEEIKHLRRKLMLSCRYGDKLNNSNENDSLGGGDCSFIEDSSQICEEVTENNKKRRSRQRKNVSPIQSKYNMRSAGTVEDEGVLHIGDVSYSSITKRKNAEKK